MEAIDYLCGIGKIIGNLHSLELLLRLFLSKTNGESLQNPQFVNETLPVTHLTNYSSLRVLINEYNSILIDTERCFVVDLSVVTIRDAIAHGRLTSLNKEFPLTLWKFSKPLKSNKNTVNVELMEVISTVWLDNKRQLILDQINIIDACANSRNYKPFGE